jgi:glutamyl/glutaminyl-tRNA synthetase
VPRFAHLPLLLGKDRSKLSKRHGSTALLEFRDRGILPEAMLNFLALLGWSPGEEEGREIFSKEELIALFDLTRVNKSGAIFDLEKLEWMNGQYLRAISLERLTTLSLPYLREAGLIGERLTDGEQEYLAKALALGRERMRLLSDAPEVIGFFLREEIEFEEKTVERVAREKGTAEHLEKLRQRLQALSDFSKEKIEETLRTLAEELGIPASALIHPTRAALTGRSVGPGLFELMEVLGKERCVRRLAEFRRRFFSKAELPVGN